eukprot:3516515-Alexandrium_andersonii.AAC.1
MGPAVVAERKRKAKVHLEFMGRDLPFAAGEGRALPARAPRGRGLLGRGLREAPDGAAGSPARSWAHVQVRYGCPEVCARG